jgi:CheY-like chemotaxis protein
MSTRLPLRVLIIEDSEFDARVIVQALRAGGYEVTWHRVETAPAMEASLKSPAVSWDVVLADYNMPEFNAPQALRILQQAGHDIPFIIVSGGIGEDVAVAAMKAGAHDYVMKGNPARLLPAVERELREAEVRRRRREAEGLLRESELRYRSLWETSPDAVLFCSTEGAIGFANPAAEKLFGWVADELTGRPLTDLEPPGGGGLGRALAGAGAGAGGGDRIGAAIAGAGGGTGAASGRPGDPGGGGVEPVGSAGSPVAGVVRARHHREAPERGGTAGARGADAGGAGDSPAAVSQERPGAGRVRHRGDLGAGGRDRGGTTTIFCPCRTTTWVWWWRTSAGTGWGRAC